MADQVDNILLSDDTSGLPRSIHVGVDALVLSTDLTLQAGGVIVASNLLRGTGNPNAGQGTPGNEGDIFQRTGVGVGELYVNADGTDTGWVLLRPIAAGATTSSTLRWDGSNWVENANVRTTAGGDGIFEGTVTAGSVTYTGTDGTSDQVLRTDGSGVTSFAAVGSLASFGTAVEITDSSNGAGSGTIFARHNHTHAHGDRGGGSLHALATDTVPGFMSAADKDKLDGFTASPGDYMVGPASATNNALARFDGTTGKLAKNSNAILTDAGALTLAAGLTGTTAVMSGNVTIGGSTTTLEHPNALLNFGDASGFVNGIVLRKADASASNILDIRSGGSGTGDRKWMQNLLANSHHMRFSRRNPSTGAEVDRPLELRHDDGDIHIANNLQLPGTGADGDGSLTMAGTLTANGLAYPANTGSSDGDIMHRSASGVLSLAAPGDLGLATTDDLDDYLLADGSRPLTGNWDAGAFDVRVTGSTARVLTIGHATVNLHNTDQIPGGAADKMAGVVTDVSGGASSLQVRVQDGSRNPIASLFVRDAASGSGAWGLHHTWVSSGSQPFVIRQGSTNYFTISNVSPHHVQPFAGSNYASSGTRAGTFFGGAVDVTGNGTFGGTGTFAGGNLLIGSNGLASVSAIDLRAASTTERQLQFRGGSILNWVLTHETEGAGRDFTLRRRSHTDGSAIDNPLRVSHSTGRTTLTLLTANGLAYPADADGSVDEILTKTAAGTIGFQSLSDLGVEADLGTGGLTNSTLRWDGSGWVENTAVRASAGGALSIDDHLNMADNKIIRWDGGQKFFYFNESGGRFDFGMGGAGFLLVRDTEIRPFLAFNGLIGLGSSSARFGTVFANTANFAGPGHVFANPSGGTTVRIGEGGASGGSSVLRFRSQESNASSIIWAQDDDTTSWEIRDSSGAYESRDLFVRRYSSGSVLDTVLTLSRANGRVTVHNALHANGLLYPADGDGNTNDLLTKTAGGVVGFQSLSDLGFDASPGDYATRIYVQSRAQNLVTNGTGLKGTNYNFSWAVWDGGEAFSATGSFRRTSQQSTDLSNEFMPVTVTNRYRLSLYAKWDGNEQPRHYFGLAFRDADGLSITASHHMRLSASDTTLAQPLTPGDTEVHLTDSSGWNAGSDAFWRRLSVYGYRNSFGFVYPDYTYTRWVIADAWEEGGINFTTHVITLKNPFPASMGNPDDPNGTWPAGHAVANGRTGSTYKYIASSNQLTQPDWTYYEGEIEGTDLSGTNVTSMFPPGTAAAQCLFLLNRNTTDPQTTWLSNIDFGLASVRVSDDNPTQVQVQSAAPGTALDAARRDHVHSVATAATDPSAVRIGNASSEGSSTSLARADHIHAVEAGAPVTISDSSNSSGSDGKFSRADHVHAHGNRGGGSLHALATGSVAGFMSAADKTKLDAFGTPGDYVQGPASATNNAVARYDGTSGKLIKNSNATLTDGGALTLAAGLTTGSQFNSGGSLVPDTAATYNIGFDASRWHTLNSVSVNTTSSITVGNVVYTATDGSADHVLRTNGSGTTSFAAVGTLATFGTPVTITDSSNGAGSGTTFARHNHTHAHGDRGGGSLHALATTSVAGFMSAADKDKLDGFDAGDGYVQGPASATNNAIAVYDGTTGKLIKNSDFIIDGDVATYDRSSAYIILGSDTGGGDSGLLYEGAIWLTSFRNGGVNNADWLTIGIHSSVHDGYLEHRRVLPNNVYAHTPLRFDYSRATTVIGSMAQGHSHNGKIIGTAKGTANLPSGSPGPWVDIATLDIGLPLQTSGWITVRGAARPNASSTHRRAIVGTFAVGRSTGNHFYTILNVDQAGHTSFNVELLIQRENNTAGTVSLTARNLDTSDIEVNGVMTVEWQYTDPGA